MASVKFDKNSKEFKMFGDFWALVQKYYIPEESSDYWASVIDDTDTFAKQFNEDECYDLARDLAVTYAGFLARKHKRMKK